MDRKGRFVPLHGPMPSDSCSVALLALPQSSPAPLYGLYEVFASVGVTWEELTGEPPAGRRFEPRIVSRDGAPIRSPIGLPVTPHGPLDEADVVVVGDVVVEPGFDPRGQWPEECAWLRERRTAGAMVCSVCSGTMVLAEAGLLDGEIATSHWSAAPFITRHYPGVRLEPERILAAAGSDRGLLTSGGASSWEDLALYLIARLSSGPEAVRAAKIFVFGDRAEGQLLYAGARKPKRHADAIVAAAQDWIADHYASANPVAQMVARSGLPERSFKRRFKAATGYTPIDYVQTLRIEEAKQLLETTDQPTDAVAAEVGYEDPAFFRRLFKRTAGITPARYRQRFARIAHPT
jgi:transcriptional regulator GlxA family with amidase domain